MDRAEKREMVATLNTAFAGTGVIFVAHYAGLTVKDMTALRARMRDPRDTRNHTLRRHLGKRQYAGRVDYDSATSHL